MLTCHLALVSQAPTVPMESVMEVAAALQRQITRDFAPSWGVAATVEPFARLDQVPAGYWPLIVRDDIPGEAAVGLHLDDHGQPLALIQANNVWSLTASHEAVEMLADPYGNRLVPGGSLRRGQGLVEYLVEVADPVAGINCAYTVNGVLVSDFVTPEYYAHPVPVPGTAYSFTGAILRPRDVADDGYVTWREPLGGEWWQAGRSGGRLRFDRLGALDSARLALRRIVDSRYTPRELIVGVPESHPQLRAARERHASEAGASAVRAAAWSLLIKRVAASPTVRVRTAAPPASPDPGEMTLPPID
jgi:hypothetical protein